MAMEGVEQFALGVIHVAKLALELSAVALVIWGGVRAIADALRAIVFASVRFTAVRLGFARYLALALEFQLGADILGTTIAPSWDQIGALGAVAAIRTALNYFLGKEMREERETLAGEAAIAAAAGESTS